MSLFSRINEFFTGKKTEKINNSVAEAEEEGMKCDVSLCSNVGKIRKNNEDNFYLDQEITGNGENEISYSYTSTAAGKVFAVFDGMGGEDLGELASLTAAVTLKEYLKDISDEKNINDLMMQYAQNANNNICNAMMENGNCSGGCTAVIVYMEKFRCIPFNIGDSRIYWLHENILEQLTEDNTLAMKKYKANIYTWEEANISRDRHKLTNFLGIDEEGDSLYIDMLEGIKLLKNDKILLCSDGLTDMCTDEEIKELLLKKDPNKSPAQLLVERALENGGKDNTTCIVLENFR